MYSRQNVRKVKGDNMTITMEINYGYVGADETIELEVDDNATLDEIYEQAESVFTEKVLDTCSFGLYDENGEEMAI